jgi:hypothetical protein
MIKMWLRFTSTYRAFFSVSLPNLTLHMRGNSSVRFITLRFDLFSRLALVFHEVVECEHEHRNADEGSSI